MAEYISVSTHVDDLSIGSVKLRDDMVDIHLAHLYFVLTKEHANQLADCIKSALSK